MIRVLHIIGSLGLGGAQVVVQQIVKHSDPNQFEHFVYPLRARNQAVPIDKNVICNSYRNFDPRKFWDILRTCREKKIDVIHTHLHKDAVAGLFSTFFLDIPVVVHEHGPILVPGFQYALFRLVFRLLHRRAAAIIAVSNAVSSRISDILGYTPSSLATIYNSIDLDRFKPNPESRKRIRDELHFNDEHVVIGFAGRIEPLKGVDVLLDALIPLIQDNPRYRAVFLGDGSMLAMLRKRANQAGIADAVRFLGFRPDVAEVLNAIDIGCMPSRLEPFGLVALEMMSMKIPLICSRVDGLGEITEDDVNALILEQISPGEITSKILALTHDIQLRQRLVENAYVFTRQFAADSFIKKIESVYVRVLNSTSKR